LLSFSKNFNHNPEPVRTEPVLRQAQDDRKYEHSTRAGFLRQAQDGREIQAQPERVWVRVRVRVWVWVCGLRRRLHSTHISPQANTTSFPLKRLVNAVANLFTKP
jgi:hypothetical protein